MPVILTWRHCQYFSFDLKVLPIPSFLLKWLIFTYFRNDDASRLLGSHRNNSQTCHSRPILIPHLSLMASKWAFVTRLGIISPFTCGKPLVKGKSPCLRLSLKASWHSYPVSEKSLIRFRKVNLRCLYTSMVQICSCPLKLINWWQPQNFLII